MTAPSFSWTGDSNVGIFRPATDTIGFTTAGTEKMRIASDGDVGIGTTAPTAKLHVNGNIIASTPTANNHVATKAYVDSL